jgi:hypothetical protein
MRDKYLVFGQALIEQTEIEEVIKSLRSAWLGTGPKTVEFERRIAAYKGVTHAGGEFVYRRAASGVSRTRYRSGRRSDRASDDFLLVDQCDYSRWRDAGAGRWQPARSAAQDAAVQNVLQQAEALSAQWAA